MIFTRARRLEAFLPRLTLRCSRLFHNALGSSFGAYIARPGALTCQVMDSGNVDSPLFEGARPDGAAPPRGEELRRAYADRALAQIPRLLSLQDRNEFSPTHGCFHREYWLCRSVDFPSAIAQFGAHSLALAYTTPFPDNPYLGSPKILFWALAGMEFWTRIQHSDGSFDEFYPNERGWAGPTGFLVYAICDSLRLLDGHLPPGLADRLRESVYRAARFLARYDEPGVLANHHAMAILPIYEAYALLGDRRLLAGFHERLDDFLRHCDEEGWCLEYDGADPGYLSATISFLGKLRKIYADERIDGVIRRAIDFCSHFVFPDGHFGGSLGSRQTLHFYPHGFELAAPRVPMAGAVAERMLSALRRGRLVPPEIQEDRYFLYRIPELLQSWIDWRPRPDPLPPLPCDGPPFTRSWPRARMQIRRTPEAYIAVNLAKGGVLKVCGVGEAPKVLASDCGILAERADGRVVTSQWIDPNRAIRWDENEFVVEGSLHFMVTKAFTPWRMILFRLFLLSAGWSAWLAYRIKGGIRRLLMTRSGASPSRFRRAIRFESGRVIVTDRIERGRGPRFERVRIGDDFSVRYVPQSRYFQSFELGVSGSYLSDADIERLNRTGRIDVVREIDLKKGLVRIATSEEP